MVILSVFSFPEFTTAFNHIPWCFYDFLKCFSSFSSVFSLFSILGFVASSYCFRFLNEGKGCPCFLTWKQSSDSVSYFKPVVLNFFPENLYDEKECLYNLPVLFIFGVLMKVKCCFWLNLLGKIETYLFLVQYLCLSWASVAEFLLWFEFLLGKSFDIIFKVFAVINWEDNVNKN